MDFGVGTKHNAFRSVGVDDGNFNYGEQIRVETSQKTSRTFWIPPLGGVSNQSGPFNFSVEPMVDQYWAANRAAIEATVSILKPNGAEIDSVEDVVAPCNLIGPSLFENIDISINGHHFPGSSGMNSQYKAMIETLLSYDQDARLTHLMCQGFHLDTPGEFGNMDLDELTMMKMIYAQIKSGQMEAPTFPQAMRREGEAGYIEPDYWDDWDEDQRLHYTKLIEKKRIEYLETHCKEHLRQDVNANRLSSKTKVNSGFVARYRLMAGSKRLNLIFPICHDFFNMTNHIGPLNKVDIKLTRSKDPFLLNSYLKEKGYKMHIHDLKLHLHTIQRKERINIPEIERFRFNQTELRKHVMLKGVTNHTEKLYFQGVLPKTIIVAMVYTRAAEGEYNYNPYNFHHFDIRQMNLLINGEANPSTGLTFDFSKPNAQIARSYRWVFENTGALSGGRGNLVSYPGFELGNFMIPFDLTPDKCNGLHNHEGKTGTIDLQLTFDKPLPESVTLISELVFNKMLINDKLNNRVELKDIQ